MNSWLTWRARLAHLMHPEDGECLCQNCAEVHQKRLAAAEAKLRNSLKAPLPTISRLGELQWPRT